MKITDCKLAVLSLTLVPLFSLSCETAQMSEEEVALKEKAPPALLPPASPGDLLPLPDNRGKPLEKLTAPWTQSTKENPPLSFLKPVLAARSGGFLRPFPSVNDKESAGDEVSLDDTTIHPLLQAALKSYIARHNAARAAVVVVAVRSGEILAAVSSESLDEAAPVGPSVPAVIAPIWPAASLFKMVVAAGFLEKNSASEVDESPEMQLSGCSIDSVSPPRLVDSHVKRPGVGKRRKRRPPAVISVSLEQAFAHSCNAYFARLTTLKLGLGNLLQYMDIFGWREGADSNIASDFFLPQSHFALAPELATLTTKAVSRGGEREEDEGVGSATEQARVPAQAAESLGRLGAGFGQVALSPMHAAWLSMIIASDGHPMPLRIFRGTEDDPGLLPPQQALISQESAQRLRQLMAATVLNGTARAIYNQARYRPLRQLVGGKTGTLRTFDNDGVVTWFSGMMPISDPQVVVAAMVIEDGVVRIKGKDLAAEALRLYYDERQTSAAVRTSEKSLAATKGE